MDGFDGLEEIEICGIGFKSAAVAAFLKKIKFYKSVKALIFASNHRDMKEKDLNTVSLTVLFCISN